MKFNTKLLHSTFPVNPKERTFALLNELKYAYIATNIGDMRTLVIHPRSTVYNGSVGEVKRSTDVYEDLIRVSVGLEDMEDLRDDFAQEILKTQERGD